MEQQNSYMLADYLPQLINGKNILITGGTTGIGRTTALTLASMGAKVMIFGRHQKELEDTLKDFESRGLAGNVHGTIADVSSHEDIVRVFHEADRYFETLDVLINNAAIGYNGIMEGSFQDWQYIVKTNLLGYMACANYALTRMKGKGSGGHIINIGSMSADIREKGSSVYVATKAGIQGFSEALRKEVNALGIKVTLIEPGAVGTDMQPDTPEVQAQKEEELKMLKTSDIAACVVYALSQPHRCDVVSVQIRPHLQEI